MSDQQLIKSAQAGNRDATEQLAVRYRRLARHIASGYYWQGADPDDIEQEALVALIVAVRDYRPGHGMTFRSFAALCIRRRLAMKLQHSQRQMRTALLAQPIRDTDGQTTDPLERVADRRADIPELAERRATIRALTTLRLSDLERRSIVGVACGYTYQEIGGDPRAIDNAVQRARQKLRQAA